jgi:MFS family permease
VWAFAVHEALDQSGALLGPLLVAAMVAISGYRLGFAVLALPGALALVTLAWLRRAVPVPAAYEHAAALRQPARADASAAAAARFPRRFWLYMAFTAVSMLGFGTFGVLAYHLQVRPSRRRRSESPSSARGTRSAISSARASAPMT